MNDQQPGTDQAAADQPVVGQPGDGQPENGQPAAAPQNDGGQAPSETASAEKAETPAQKKPRARKQSTAKKTRTVELTLTVTGTAEGEWQAELTHSGKRVLQGLEIPAAAVSKAAAELHEDISETIESVLSAAREQHEAKLAELEAEVERVRKALAGLES